VNNSYDEDDYFYDPKIQKAIDRFENEYYAMQMKQVQTCDWCGAAPVVYVNEAFQLCEKCTDQLFDS
jgi:hypothetical protein